MSIYKKFTAQDIAVVPFNAHKQYDFTSGSASSNSINHFNTSWTSESIDIYSSGSATSYGLPADNINTIKYYQTDHLFYKNFKKDIGYRFGNKHYLNQKRDLYEKTNILSIPTGLYGHEIKPGTFSLLSNGREIVDDSNGNLIIKGTNVSDYPTDIRTNLFRLDPIKAFKRYDLNTFEGYHNEVFYLDGEKRVNKILNYSSIDAGEFDDSYYFNPIRYKNVHFATSSLGSDACKFSSIGFDSFDLSRVTSPDNEVFNFNPEDDFAIAFNIKLAPYATTLDEQGLISPPGIGQIIHDGIVFHVTGSEAYLVVSADPSTIAEGYVRSFDNLSRISSPLDSNGLSNLENGDEANKGRMLAVDVFGPGYIDSNGHLGDNNIGLFAPSVIGLQNSNFTQLTGTFLTFVLTQINSVVPTLASGKDPFIGGGLENTKNILNHIANVSDAPLFNFIRNGGIPQKRTDTWIANYDEVNLINQTLGFTDDIRDAKSNGRIFLTVNSFSNDNVFFPPNNIGGLSPNPVPIGIFPNFGGKGMLPSGFMNDIRIATSNFVPGTHGPGNDGEIVVARPVRGISTSNLLVRRIIEPGDLRANNILIIRKINWKELDHSKRYIITKSTTKTVVPTPSEGQAQILKTKTKGTLQPKDVPAEPQFPFSIYHISNSLYFERSDGEYTRRVLLENSPLLSTDQYAHIVCEKSGSKMKIQVNGGSGVAGGVTVQTTNNPNTQYYKQVEGQTQNSANIYIGSKGNDSLGDDFYLNGINFSHTLISSSDRYFNGYLGNINIYDKRYFLDHNTFGSQTVHVHMSESINHSPYIGNIFYQNGFVTITHPKYQDILSGSSGNGTIERLRFQGSHLIYENEYQCTIGEEEFNDTLNISARKIRSHQSEDLANFATGSLFKPYITTVGLYNEDNELLVVGKLGSPIRISDETDSTIIVRWDT